MSHNEHSEHSHFIVPVKYYAMTLSVLLVLTVITVYTAKFIDLGWGNIVLAMVIATIKGSFVVMFFMGLRWDKGLVNLAAFLSALVVFAIFVLFVLMDVSTRGNISVEEAGKQNLKTPVKVEKY